MLAPVFISHAYEDKDSFVRSLAQALEARRLRPWYDESGDPQQTAGSHSPGRLIPVWHDVDAEAVMVRRSWLIGFWPCSSLPALLFAYDELPDLGGCVGWHPPVIADDWWLDVIEASAKTDREDWPTSRQRPQSYWGFPLPEHSAEPQARGHRLAWAAAQLTWHRAPAAQKISQMTPPAEVIKFIDSLPGLAMRRNSHSQEQQGGLRRQSMLSMFRRARLSAKGEGIRTARRDWTG